MQLQAADRFHVSKPEKVKTHIARARDLARQGLAEARSSIWVLSQDGDAYSHIAEVLSQLAEQLTLGTATTARVTILGTPCSLPPNVGLHLLRIAQEALNNALHHAAATELEIHLNYAPEQIVLCLRDNGNGFNPDCVTGGFGLKSMQQRADSIGAQWQLSSTPGSGTEITTIVPLTAKVGGY
jgi:signal transduction histidine kinase